jgi:hypothetical protein
VAELDIISTLRRHSEQRRRSDLAAQRGDAVAAGRKLRGACGKKRNLKRSLI